MDQDSCFMGGIPSEIDKEVVYLSVLIPMGTLQRNTDKRKLLYGIFAGDFSHMGNFKIIYLTEE